MSYHWASHFHKSLIHLLCCSILFRRVWHCELMMHPLWLQITPKFFRVWQILSSIIVPQVPICKPQSLCTWALNFWYSTYFRLTLGNINHTVSGVVINEGNKILVSTNWFCRHTYVGPQTLLCTNCNFLLYLISPTDLNGFCFIFPAIQPSQNDSLAHFGSLIPIASFLWVIFLMHCSLAC